MRRRRRGAARARNTFAGAGRLDRLRGDSAETVSGLGAVVCRRYLAGFKQRNRDGPRAHTIRSENDVGSPLAGDSSAAIARERASYKCMVTAIAPAQKTPTPSITSQQNTRRSLRPSGPPPKWRSHSILAARRTKSDTLLGRCGLALAFGTLGLAPVGLGEDALAQAQGLRRGLHKLIGGDIFDGLLDRKADGRGQLGGNALAL